MLEVAAAWSFILITAFVVGFAFLSTFRRDGFAAEVPGFFPLAEIYAGLGIFTVYAQFFSLFHGVGAAADLFILIATVIICILLRHRLGDALRKLWERLSLKKVLLIAGLFLLFALFSSSGYMHYDSDLYHAQSIRWIEEYGIVPGLGNLHTRLAYNSAAFPLTALFSFRYLLGRSLHPIAGLYAYLLLLLCLPLFSKRALQGPQIEDFVRIAALYYLFNIFDEMTAPASDYFIVLNTFALVLLWLSCLRRGADDPVPFALLSLFALIIMEYKLSGGVLVLLALWPGYLLMKKKEIRRILLFFGLGVLTIAPFLIRNVVLSGYLIYPAPGLDLFSFEFKIPAGIAAYDAAEIRAYARGLLDASVFFASFREWFPGWLSSLGAVDRGMFLFSVLCLPVVLLLTIFCFIRKKRESYGIIQHEVAAEGRRSPDALWCIYEGLVFLTAVTGGAFVFWFVNAPLWRYGCVFPYLLPALMLGCLRNRFHPEKLSGKTAAVWGAFLVFFFGYKAVLFGRGTAELFPRYRESLVHQQDYGDYTDVIASYDLDGSTIYYPTEGDRTGYDYFPSTTMKREDIELRGETVGDGFRSVE